jgi:hypothetical protein
VSGGLDCESWKLFLRPPRAGEIWAQPLLHNEVISGVYVLELSATRELPYMCCPI